MLEADAKKLAEANVDFLFHPEPGEIYPPGFATYVHVEGLSERLEGRTRPGHFRGVTTVVLKLLEIVQPHYAYFGRKDAQQVKLIQRMVQDLNVSTEIVVCPIVREPDGLALSSRNVYLNTEERRAALVLHRALSKVREEISAGVRDTLQLQSAMRHIMEAEPLARLDYAEIVDAETFEPVLRVRRPCYALLAAYIGKTRLIDNLLVEASSSDWETLTFQL
jgi:pantoate--beta-alanine ligase